MRRQRKFNARKDSLLSQYSETLGEMMMRRNTELAIRAATAEAELANRSKSAFLGTMSHELRTPLNSIIGFADVILSMRPGPDAVTQSAEYAAHISKSGRRMLEVVTDVLDISKIEAGSFTLNCQPAEVAEIVQAAVATVQVAIAERSQTLDVRVPRDLPMINLDYKRAKQVLVNLLSNANKFTGERGRIILVAKKNEDGGATIAIADTGVGMAADQIATALRSFGQVQGHLARTAEGTGLGLPLARGIMRCHGGDLRVESQPGQGTTVFVTFPADAEKSSNRP